MPRSWFTSSAPSKNVSAMYFARRGSPGRRQASAYAPGSARRWIGMARSLCDDGSVAVIEPTVAQILAFCEEDPVERVFLEDVVPSGKGCGAFARAAAGSRARMVIGEEGAVDDLWAAAGPRIPSPREDRPGQPV